MFSKIGAGYLILGSLLIIALSLLGWMYFDNPKTGYVVIGQVFESFEMKKEMQKKYENSKNAAQKIIDSLQFELQVTADKFDKEKNPDKEEVMRFEQKRDEFFKRRQKFEEDVKSMSAEFDKQILTQLNQYAQDYGKAHGYTYIFGNDNNGSLMYAKEAEDITKEVIQYINEKYQGKK